MLLSLILTSLDREKELIKYVDSLNNQIGIDFKDLQLIFIDQGDNSSPFTKLNCKIDFVYIKHSRCSLSKARNIGLKYVKGKYYCFPDDDCWYNIDTLSKVLFLLCSKNLDGLVIKATNEEGLPINNFAEESQYLDIFRHCGALSISLYFRTLSSMLYFDENIGVGSEHNLLSGEETDYLIRYMKLGTKKILYDPSIEIHHPISQMVLTDETILKQYYYARGLGYIMKKNHYPVHIILKQLLRPLVGFLKFLLSFNFMRAKKSLFLLKGRIEGLFYKFD